MCAASLKMAFPFCNDGDTLQCEVDILKSLSRAFLCLIVLSRYVLFPLLSVAMNHSKGMNKNKSKFWPMCETHKYML